MYWVTKHLSGHYSELPTLNTLIALLAAGISKALDPVAQGASPPYHYGGAGWAMESSWLWPEESPRTCSAALTTQWVVYCVTSSQQQHSYTLQGLRFFSLATEAYSACKNRMMSIWFNNILFYVKRYRSLTSNDKFQVELRRLLALKGIKINQIN